MRRSLILLTSKFSRPFCRYFSARFLSQLEASLPYFLCTLVQNNQQSRCMCWATRLSVPSFAALARSAVLTCSLVRSLIHFQARGKVYDKMAIFTVFFFLFWTIAYGNHEATFLWQPQGRVSKALSRVSRAITTKRFHGNHEAMFPW